MHLHRAGEAAVSEGNLQRTMGEQKSPRPGPTPLATAWWHAGIDGGEGILCCCKAQGYAQPGAATSHPVLPCTDLTGSLALIGISGVFRALWRKCREWEEEYVNNIFT